MSWALGSGTILQGLNSSLVAVALVPIALYFGSSSAIPWIVTSLYIASAVGSPTGGRLADLFGARRIYVVGLIIVLCASVIGPFVPDANWLVGDRVLLGLGTSLQFPSAMAIIRQQAAKRRQGAVGAIGIIALCGQTTAALGPTIGGLVVVISGWQGIFWINLPFIAASLTLVLVFVPRDPVRIDTGWRDTIRSIDPPGILLFVVGLTSLMIGLLTDSPTRFVWFIIAIPTMLGFVAHELRARRPFLDVRLLARYGQFTRTCGRAVLTFISFYCVFYGLPQWLEESRHLDPAQAGLLMFPVFGVGVLSTVTATRLGARIPPRLLLVFGTAAMVVAGGIIVLTVTTTSPIWLLVIVSALLGIPNGFNNLGNQLILHHSVPETAAGAASGIYRTAQYIGAALSAVIVANSVGPLQSTGGIRQLGTWILTLGGIMLVTNILALRRGGRTLAVGL